MATRLHFQRFHAGSRLIVVPVRFRRAREGAVWIDEPDLDDRGWSPGENLPADMRGALVGMTEGDTISVGVERVDIESSAVLYVSSARPDVVTVDEVHPVPLNGIIQLTGVKGFYETQPAAVRVHLGRPGGPVLASLGVCVYKRIVVPLQFHLVRVAGATVSGEWSFLPHDLSPILEHVSAVWQPCGIAFETGVDQSTRVRAATVDTIDVVSLNGKDKPQDIPELRILLNQATLDAVVNIWIVRRLVDSGAASGNSDPVTVPYARLDEFAGARTPGIVLPMPAPDGRLISDWINRDVTRRFAHALAHELGHFFGLVHARNTGDGPPAKDSWSKRQLMYPTPEFPFDPVAVPTLTDPERAFDVGYQGFTSGARVTIKGLKGYEEDAETPRVRNFAGVFTSGTILLKASIAQVELTSGVQVARRRTQVPQPNWIADEDLTDEEDGGSLRPAVYALATGNRSAKITVTIERASAEDDESLTFERPADRRQTGILTGDVDGLEIQAGQCPLEPGTHVIDAVITNPPAGIAHYSAEAGWTLETPCKTAKVENTTLLEIFFVLDVPMKGTYSPALDLTGKHRQYAVGVWKEVLELLCRADAANLGGYSDPAAVVARLTTYLHNEYGMKYLMAAAAFGSNFQGHMFDLAGYITKQQVDEAEAPAPRGYANCGDQAAALMAFSHAAGIPVEWRAARPFGLIRTTNLMGTAGCNSVDWERAPLVDATAPARLGFDIHCFNEYAGKIYDATIGPHLGTETLAEYLEAAVDRTPAYYEYPDRVWPSDRSTPPTSGRPPWWGLPEDVEAGERMLITRRYYTQTTL